MKPLLRRFARYAALLLALCLVQITVMPLVSVAGIAPDLVLIGVVLIALRGGQQHATVAGFLAGLFLDCSVGEVVGLSALALTVAGFAAGYFHAEDTAQRAYRTPRCILATAVACAAGQTVAVLAYVRAVSSDVPLLLLRHGAGTIAATVLCAVAFVLIASRTRRRVSFAG